MAKFLGIDYGLERTGLAISDPAGTMAIPLETLHLHDFATRSALLDAIANRARDYNIQSIVTGLPLAVNNDSLINRQIQNVVKRLKHRLDLPFYFMPEELSSLDAEQYLKAAGMKGGKLKNVLDQQSACLILQSFLNLPEHKRMRA